MTATLTPVRTVTYRSATEADLPALLELGSRFLARTPFGQVFPFAPEPMTRSLLSILETGKVYVAEAQGTLVGAIAGVVWPHQWTGQLVYVEFGWWTDPAFRGRVGLRLWRLAKAYAEAHGAVAMMGSGPDDPAIDRLYARLGYARVEIGHYLPLSAHG